MRGLIQVEPPFAILERMVTIRVHLDPADTTQAPLRIVPESDRLGRLPEASIRHVVEWGERLCFANRGDVWLYATPIVHVVDACSRLITRPSSCLSRSAGTECEYPSAPPSQDKFAYSKRRFRLLDPRIEGQKPTRLRPFHVTPCLQSHYGVRGTIPRLHQRAIPKADRRCVGRLARGSFAPRLTHRP